MGLWFGLFGFPKWVSFLLKQFITAILVQKKINPGKNLEGQPRNLEHFAALSVVFIRKQVSEGGSVFAGRDVKGAAFVC